MIRREPTSISLRKSEIEDLKAARSEIIEQRGGDSTHRMSTTSLAMAEQAQQTAMEQNADGRRQAMQRGGQIPSEDRTHDSLASQAGG